MAAGCGGGEMKFCRLAIMLVAALMLMNNMFE
jgi:hypothetical protein